MKLVAIYLIENSLPHVFGENHDGVMLNLGGKYLYTITGRFKENSVDITRRLNDSYIKSSFWDEDIQSINSVVGANGTGKSSILKNIADHKNCINIYESNGLALYQIHGNYKDYVIELNSENKEWLLYQGVEEYPKPYQNRLFYSPLLDFNLSDIDSPINLSSYFKSDFKRYYLDLVERQVDLMTDDVLIDEIKRIYPDFPKYNKITISTRIYTLEYFLKIYEGTNVGGMTDINDVRGFFENKEPVYDSKGINFNISRLWNTEGYKELNKDRIVLNENNQIKYLELILLSICFLDDTFGMFHETGNDIQIEEVLKSESFDSKLNLFFKKRISNTNKYYHEHLKELGNDYNLGNYDLLLSKTVSYNITNQNESFNGKEAIISIIDRYCTIYNFMKVLKDEFLNFEGLVFHITKFIDKDRFLNFYRLYESLVVSLPDVVEQMKVFDFLPDKKLSSGEKSLLDFYGSIHSYLYEYGETFLDPVNRRFVLLLDEPELGYHPLWKRKFVLAINKTLSILFKKFLDDKFSLQIIFTTHDPLTLSDIPKQNIIYLKKENDVTRILNEEEKLKMKSFGANIHDLLSDSFFINDGLIGDFAKSKIEGLINWINRNKEKRSESFDEELRENQSIIELIDEPILRNKLTEMISPLCDSNAFEKSIIQKQIEELQVKQARL